MKQNVIHEHDVLLMLHKCWGKDCYVPLCACVNFLTAILSGCFNPEICSYLDQELVFQVLPRDESGEAEVSEGRLSVELCSSTCTNK